MVIQLLLARGLFFVPTIHYKYNHGTCTQDLDSFTKSYIKKWAKWIPKRAKNILLDTIEGLKYGLFEADNKPIVPNLSRTENRALIQLVENRDLVMSKADL